MMDACLAAYRVPKMVMDLEFECDPLHIHPCILHEGHDTDCYVIAQHRVWACSQDDLHPPEILHELMNERGY
jgi:hypothetical protein